MDNPKPLNRIKVMLAERMVTNKELAEMLGKDPATVGRNAWQRSCHRFQMGDKHLPAQLRESD